MININIILSDKQLKDIENDLKQNNRGNFDGCLCGYYEFKLDDIGYVTMEVHCRKSNKCPSHMEWFVDDVAKIWSNSLSEIGRVPTINEAKEDNIEFLGYLIKCSSEQLKEIIRYDIIKNHIWNNTNEYGQKEEESKKMQHGKYYIFISEGQRKLSRKIEPMVGKFVIEYNRKYIIDRAHPLRKDNIVSISNNNEVYELNDGVKELFKLKDKEYYIQIQEITNNLTELKNQLNKRSKVLNEIKNNISKYMEKNKNNVDNKTLNQLNKGLRNAKKKIDYIVSDIEKYNSDINIEKIKLRNWKLTFSDFINSIK